MIFDAKLGENFRRKVHYAVDGHKTEALAVLTCSTAVLRDSVRILLIIVALSDLVLQYADMQNTYLVALAIEKCYAIASPKFAEETDKNFVAERVLCGLKESANKTFVTERVLCGLKGSATAFRNFFAEALENISFYLSHEIPRACLSTRMHPGLHTNSEF